MQEENKEQELIERNHELNEDEQHIEIEDDEEDFDEDGDEEASEELDVGTDDVLTMVEEAGDEVEERLNELF